MKDFADRRGDDVLTKENLGNRVQVKEFGVDIGKTAFLRIQSRQTERYPNGSRALRMLTILQ